MTLTMNTINSPKGGSTFTCDLINECSNLCTGGLKGEGVGWAEGGGSGVGWRGKGCIVGD